MVMLIELRVHVLTCTSLNISLHGSIFLAWTLLGHEYLELKNTAASIQCYRRAVQFSLGARDYRAWYGLGQVYEMLHSFQHALYYYKKATALKSNDARMWSAVGKSRVSVSACMDAVYCVKVIFRCWMACSWN
jgi:anaphase-promoting complex subunit 8